jgi:hypothetical protein
MKDGYLAPTIQQRLGYIDWLHVYAKDRCKIPVRMAALVDDYTVCSSDSHLPRMAAELDFQKSVWAYSVRAETWIRYDTPTFYDVFEPTFLATALSLDHNLGHLIFGAPTWVALGGKPATLRDPLTVFFEEQDLYPHNICSAHPHPCF